MDANVSKPIHSFYIYFYFFFFTKLVKGHCPGMVTSGGNVAHKNFTEMRRLDRDETPFLLDICWQPFSFLYFPYKLPTQGF
jgi:hypothetical protein